MAASDRFVCIEKQIFNKGTHKLVCTITTWWVHNELFQTDIVSLSGMVKYLHLVAQETKTKMITFKAKNNVCFWS